MIRAYGENYLYHARMNLGCMMDVGVNQFHYSLVDFYNLFLKCSLSRRFAEGEPNVLVGHSGIELAYEVFAENDLEMRITTQITVNRGPEYWTGWALAYYQWSRIWTFSEINTFAPIDNVYSLYHPYHEMDISHFVDTLDEWYHTVYPDTRLKRFRRESGLSQAQLASLSGVPQRTIQQYEQRQKNINAARADAILSLAKALHCVPTNLLEPV